LNKQGASGFKLDKMLQKALNYLQQGKLDKAEKQYKVILKKYPIHSDALNLYGVVLHRRNKPQQAIGVIKKAIRINPNTSAYHFNLGVICQGSGKLVEAIKAYENSLKLRSDNSAVWSNLGSSLQQLERYQVAIGNNIVKPELAFQNYENDVDTVDKNQGLLDKAINCYQQALSCNPKDVSALVNLGSLYKETGQIDKALDIFDHALNEVQLSNAGNDQIHWSKSTALLMLGQYREGWGEYEWGLQNDLWRTTLKYSIPIWSRDYLTDKHLLLVAEQGVGDEIMFLSCLEDIFCQFKKVTIECDSRLVALFERSFPTAHVFFISNKKYSFAPPPLDLEIDCQLSIGTLPHFYRNDEAEFPRHSGYLVPDLQKKEKWEHRFNKLGRGVKVGISWRGGRDKEVIEKRSTLLLKHWAVLLQTQGVYFINLQYGECKEDLLEVSRQLDISIYDWDDVDPLKDLDEVAAQVAALDIVISIDNTTVHMAGALGIPTWTLLPYAADWRWQMNRIDTPWYPSMRLFRQTVAGDWDAVFSKVSEQLKSFILNVEKKMLNDVSKAIVINDSSVWREWGGFCTSVAIIDQLKVGGFSVSTISTNELYECQVFPQDLSDFDSDVFCQEFIHNNSSIIQRIAEVDVVVINGEGVLHNITKAAMTLLYVAYISKLGLNKPVHLINHSCYPEDSTEITDALKNGIYKKVYQQLDTVAIREGGSASLMEKLGLNIIHSFDCTPLYIQKIGLRPRENKAKTILIVSSVGWGEIGMPAIASFMREMYLKGFVVQVLIGNSVQDRSGFIEALNIQEFKNWELIKSENVKEWLQIIANAQLVISGDYQAIVAAAFLKTAIVALHDNSPKIKELIKMLQLPVTYALDTMQESVVDMLTSNSNYLSEDRMKELYDLALLNFQFTSSMYKK